MSKNINGVAGDWSGRGSSLVTEHFAKEMMLSLIPAIRNTKLMPQR